MSKPMARILQSCKTIRTPNNSFSLRSLAILQ